MIGYLWKFINNNYLLCLFLQLFNFDLIMRYTIFSLLILALVFSCNYNLVDNVELSTAKIEKELLNKARIYLDSLPELPDLSNDGTATARVDLGKHLFLDKRLSANETKSCNSCHDLNNYGVDNEPTSPGFQNERGTRNSPSVYNASFGLAQFWDGRATGLKEQARGPIFDKKEMGMPDEATLLARLENDENYNKMFAAAFPGESTPLNMDNLLTAIESFEERLVTYSRFDSYLKGDVNALSEQEKRGLNTFIDRGCIPCHSGGATGGNMYQGFPQVGQMEDYTGVPNSDQGRFQVTGKSTDKNLFKVPSLRNVAKTAPYFHDGSVNSLEQAVKIMAKAQLNTDLPENEIEDIVAFLNSLTGELPNF